MSTPVLKRLNPQSPIFSELLAGKAPAWWNLFLQDPKIYMDVRKDNSIDVYHNGGAIISGLKYGRKGFTGEIHYKYLLPDNEAYIKLSMDSLNVHLAKKDVPLISLSSFNQDTLKRIKANIANHHNASSEKGIQARFILNSGAFIDSEFAYNQDDDKSRIDLVWVDTTNKKILFVELKTIGDKRLYDGGIETQLKKYHDFVFAHKIVLLEYYKILFEIKKNLGILPPKLRNLSSLDGYEIETRPLLLLGDCNQNWINNNAEDINARINNLAVGAYYFGKPGYDCDLIRGRKMNRYVF